MKKTIKGDYSFTCKYCNITTNFPKNIAIYQRKFAERKEAITDISHDASGPHFTYGDAGPTGRTVVETYIFCPVCGDENIVTSRYIKESQ